MPDSLPRSRSQVRVLVCGGRDYADADAVSRTLARIHVERGISAIIEGGARGADALARDWAWKALGQRTQTFDADWKKHGRAAGPIRNRQMLTEGKPDLVVAFPGGRGTFDMIEAAHAHDVEVIEVTP